MEAFEETLWRQVGPHTITLYHSVVFYSARHILKSHGYITSLGPLPKGESLQNYATEEFAWEQRGPHTGTTLVSFSQ